MERVDRELSEIRALLRTVKPAEAERRLRTLILQLGPEELRSVEQDLRPTIDGFLPKRRRDLTELLNRALQGAEATETVDAMGPFGEAPDVEDAPARLSVVLQDLAEHHIFQWSTYYRDALAPLFERLVIASRDQDDSGARIHDKVRQEFASHAYAIFGHGYQYTMRLEGINHQIALAKNLAGLQRFLELPVELYSTLSGQVTTVRGATALRRCCSATLAGILEGIASVRFGSEVGRQVLTRTTRLWAHYLGFMTSEDLGVLADQLDEGRFRDGVLQSAIPVARAIDQLVGERRFDYSALPVIGQFDFDSRRLTIALEPPARGADARLIELQTYFDADTITTGALDEALGRGVALIAGPFRADISDWTGSHDALRSLVLNTVDPVLEEQLVRRAKEIVGYAIANAYGDGVVDAPLGHNFARDFPLHNPFLSRYFHVHRPSVRSLLRRFERRNGVRLWCSVRRSGKTTACFDLSTTTGTSTVVSQTCDRTGQHVDADAFYMLVLAAIEDGRQISDAFFRLAVERCSPARKPNDIRYVFVLDEYETLFERLRLAVHRNPELRYTVVQPLLNQMVEFTGENLLVFIGQRPDAHFILMDQNQLSAYVQQDAFPLFEHGDGSTEFAELLRKVATERVALDSGFVDAVYAETAGHPFLTVKMMIEVFDWLIATRRSVRALHLSETDFRDFAEPRLSSTHLGVAQEYQFFSQAISEALSADGKRETPWLHAIYAVLKRIAQNSPSDLSCTRADFEAIVESLRIPDELGYSADQLLGGGSQANFFRYTDSEVGARIPILGRLAAVARPRLSW